MPGGAPPMMNIGAGEILLNRAESAALAAMETEDDELTGVKRAADESGLSADQVRKLKSRAEVALRKGLTLKGIGFTKKPTPQAPDEPGLTRDKVQKAEGTKYEKATATKTTVTAKKKATEANAATAVVTRRPSVDLYTCPLMDDYGVPTPSSESEPEPEAGESNESNVVSTLASMLNRARKRRRFPR